MLSFRDRFSLAAQNLIAQVLSPVIFSLGFAWLRLIRGYRIPRLRTFRNRLTELIGRDRGPLLICPNHLTLIDSLIIMWALNPGWRSVIDPLRFPWNTPEKRNFSGGLFMRIFCYLGKCLYVVRQGPQEETKKLLERIKLLFARRQSVMIFPEGTRSRTGRVDTENFAYGVGRIVDEARGIGADLRVLCIYLRGKEQSTWSDLPKRGEQFAIDVRLVDPSTPSRGLRAARDIASQIVGCLADMESAFFAHPYAGRR